MLCASAWGAQGVFQVENAIAAPGNYISSVSVAQELINKQIPSSNYVITTAPVINYEDPQNPGGGFHFANKVAFPINTPAVDQNFALYATGNLVIPSAGNYTFGVHSDDGFELNVGTFTMEFLTPRGGADTLATFNFTKAGTYPLQLWYFQQWSQSHVELYASPGSYSAYGAPGSNFQLINSSATGALQLAAAPEPGTMALIGLLSLPLLARRRN